MAPGILKKRKHEESSSKRPSKKSRQQQRQQHYSSPSASSTSDADEDAPDFDPIQLADSSEDEDESPLPTKDRADIPSNNIISQASTSATDSDSSPSPSDHSSASTTSNPTSTTTPSQPPSSSRRQTQKRNDPTAFATSISAILSSKLTTTKRSDPVLARSTTAQDANASVANSKLEAKAKRKMREDRRAALERGRVRDVLLGTTATAGVGDGVGGEGEGEGEKKSVGQLQDEERRLRKTAQRGVVKLFNAVRASQVKAEEARAKGGTRGRKEERVEEMSKLGFLEMVAAGGGGGNGKAKGKGNGVVGEGIEEA